MANRNEMHISGSESSTLLFLLTQVTKMYFIRCVKKTSVQNLTVFEFAHRLPVLQVVVSIIQRLLCFQMLENIRYSLYIYMSCELLTV